MARSDLTATADPAAIRAIFASDRCLGCSVIDNDGGAEWKFASGLVLTLKMPDESKCRYLPNWHIGVWP